MVTFLTFAAALFASGLAMPTINPAHDSVTPSITPSITFCTSTVFGSGDCIIVPISIDGACITFTGGLAFFNDNVGSAEIAGGFFCTFFTFDNCMSVAPTDSFLLEASTTEVFNFEFVPGEFGTTSFLDQVSSYSCSPI